MNILKDRATNESQLERWLGKASVSQMQTAINGWYGPKIAVAGVPGKVFIEKDGNFRGRIATGQFASALDIGEAVARNAIRDINRGLKKGAHSNRRQLNTGFASLSDLISEATAGAKRRDFAFQKNGPTGVVGSCHSLWRLGGWPAAGLAPVAPNGLAPLDSTAGGFTFTNPTNPDTQHFVSGFPLASVAGNTLLLYDRIFQVLKLINSTGTEANTGVPTRYQNQTSTAEDYIGGNFVFVEVGVTAMANTAHNWTVCQYTDQDGNVTQTIPSFAGNPGAVATIADRLDMPNGTWFAPLAPADVGIKALTQMQCSALVATGVPNFVMGHPLAFMPCPVANMVCVYDGINTAFNLVRIFDDACLAFLEINKPSTSATNYTGSFTTVAG